MRRILVAALAVVLTLSFPVLSSDSAEAATYIGCKMKSSKIYWKKATTNTAYYTAAVDAMNNWGLSTGKIGFQIVNSGANLTVANGNFGNVGFDGIMKNGTSMAAPGCANGNWDSTAFVWLNNYYTDSYSAAGKRSVFAHEIGHALGLAHNSAGPCSATTLMHPSSQVRFAECGISITRPDDIAGIKNLY